MKVKRLHTDGWTFQDLDITLHKRAGAVYISFTDSDNVIYILPFSRINMLEGCEKELFEPIGEY